MKNFEVPDLVELLWATLRDTEGREDFRADDSAFIEFRRNVLRIIADLELVRKPRFSHVASDAGDRRRLQRES
jgi:hypothetical protein